ncbi:cAMP-responsive element modulator-like [Stylophora pistillata]|uniref:cAMP-responsive element modulator n=1 Tax=Stylophora pistillata TaxID=50429 RepID=A0A2B4SQ30_STYPI|nr:cAMP-responsive element modulator-like [Stylophora pistillata]PFX30485.1 cAMP-responsive element modulator [Stylophora pistillata]
MEQIEEQSNVTEMENGSTVTVQQGQVLQQSSPQTSMPPPMQTPSVIQANQQSVIQTAQSIHSASLQGQQISLAQAVQGVNDTEDPTGGVLDEESKKRRDILSRRPSYRKIFNELSGSESPTKVETISEDIQTQSEGTEGASPIAVITTSTLNYQQAPQTVTIPGTIQIVTSGEGLQTVPMAQNSSGTVVQYQQQQQDGQQYIYAANPGEVQVQQVQVSNTGTMYAIPANQQQYIRGHLPPGVVLQNSPGIGGNGQQIAEDASRKREMRLMKNREAAKECRRKKKEYVKCLENRVAVLENQNKTLIEELKTLKDLYCHKSE